MTLDSSGAASPVGTDVLIIGSGMIGCALADRLTLDGASVRVCEASELASGTAPHTARAT
ncbi:FAD-dependent oxidoreductase [Nocardia sp. CA-107356]|uniref:FAD-dependent oxidoreductase n=1 Tax=Nocardia sp. CA-107356 TaxID=3239972 RepID=UPI003D8FE397